MEPLLFEWRRIVREELSRDHLVRLPVTIGRATVIINARLAVRQLDARALSSEAINLSFSWFRFTDLKHYQPN